MTYKSNRPTYRIPPQPEGKAKSPMLSFIIIMFILLLITLALGFTSSSPDHVNITPDGIYFNGYLVNEMGEYTGELRKPHPKHDY